MSAATPLLAGARAVNINSQNQHFPSPDPLALDISLGSEQSWPPFSVLLLDAYKPADCDSILQQAAGYENRVWILKLDKSSGRAVADMQLIRNKQATLRNKAITLIWLQWSLLRA
jgi:hypothetical protein